MRMWALALFGVPAVVALVIAYAIGSTKRRIAFVVALGALLGLGLFWLAFFESPLTSDPYNGCSDCEAFLGHWWEPGFFGLLLIIGFLGWIVGVFAGGTLRAFRRRG